MTNNQELVNVINSLKDSVEFLSNEVEKLRKDLKSSRDESEKLRFRLSELENALRDN